MKVTNITFDDYSPQPKGICAECSIELDNVLCIHKIFVIQGKSGLFIAFPNTRETRLVNNKAHYSDIVHPTKNEIRQHISDEVLKVYSEYKV